MFKNCSTKSRSSKKNYIFSLVVFITKDQAKKQVKFVIMLFLLIMSVYDVSILKDKVYLCLFISTTYLITLQLTFHWIILNRGA